MKLSEELWKSENSERIIIFIGDKGKKDAGLIQFPASHLFDKYVPPCFNLMQIWSTSFNLEMNFF